MNIGKTLRFQIFNHCNNIFMCVDKLIFKNCDVPVQARFYKDKNLTDGINSIGDSITNLRL